MTMVQTDRPLPAQPVAGCAELIEQTRLDYDAAWALQRRFVEERLNGRRPDTLLLLEHDPVFTVGRSGRQEHWGRDARVPASAIPLRHVERGGSITYHGPGQLMAYPILKLTDFCPGPRAYVHRLEEVVMRTLAGWGIEGYRRERLPGVWTGRDETAKIAAVGVRIERGVTMHGIALNVDPDLAPFSQIVPCGIAGCRVTSMTAVTGAPIDMAAVRARFAQAFARVFGLTWRRPS